MPIPSLHAPSLVAQDPQITQPRRATSQPASVVLGNALMSASAWTPLLAVVVAGLVALIGYALTQFANLVNVRANLLLKHSRPSENIRSSYQVASADSARGIRAGVIMRRPGSIGQRAPGSRNGQRAYPAHGSGGAMRVPRQDARLLDGPVVQIPDDLRAVRLGAGHPLVHME